MSEESPFIAVGAEDLGLKIRKGDIIAHKREDGVWEEAALMAAEKVLKDGSKEESDMLLSYKLADGQSYLAGLGGRMLKRPGIKLVRRANGGGV